MVEGPIYRDKIENMDAATPLPGCKRQKVLNGQIVSEDRISNLSDGVLQYILSFLPTKYAVRTCVLSRRWQFLWTSISKIDFVDIWSYSCEKNDQYPLEGTCILDILERVLALRDASDIEKFRFSCHAEVSSFRVSTLISAAIRHRVQELVVSVNCGNLVFPRCLFTCESLTVLKLEVNCILEVPTSICFPSLKTLDLSEFTFLDEHSIERLISSCPLLQELSLISCGWENIKSLSIFGPCLKSLIIDYYPFPTSDDHLADVKIKVYVEDLMFLRCNDQLTFDVLLCNLTSLSEAVILNFSRSLLQKEKARRALRRLVGIHNVESLTISNGTIHLLTIEHLLDQLPTFSKLINLEVDMEFDYFASRALKIFLQHAPNIESLEFVVGSESYMFFDERHWISEPVPQCLKSSLKRFIFHNFNGREMEINFLKYFLKNAILLETMEIYCTQSLSKNSKNQEGIHDLLRGFIEAELAEQAVNLCHTPVPLCFKSSLKRFIFYNFSWMVMEINLLKYFLKNAVLLEMMEIYCTLSLSENSKKQDEGSEPYLLFDEHHWISEPVPQCLKSSLKRFIFHNFNGKEMEINLLKYFLKNAILLEIMKIHSSQSLWENSKKHKEVSDLLQMLPRGSASCLIVFK